ncbi:hypothetical protein Q5P01_012569 [Channa striata]|uniref:VWFD domain-containing protein n=1 Tax=Channa striata TaxID=64152 RepID=A0AA88MSL8_CHASR|nr:hypothetical protein Q5P01_012569 [Channa striata]
MVYINGKQVFPAYSNADLTITSTAIALLLTIPEIQAVVIFKGLLFSVEVPFSLFHGNTEGQCGNCDNDQINDCRLPNGQISPSCSDMAHNWHVPDKNKPYCEKPTPSPPPSPTTSTPCKPVICDILTSEVFEKCHKVINPQHFYEACKFDVCHTPTSMGCSSLQVYATMCAEASVCVDWRNATKGQCGPVTCTKEGEVLVKKTVDCCERQTCGDTPVWDYVLRESEVYVAVLIRFEFLF